MKTIKIRNTPWHVVRYLKKTFLVYSAFCVVLLSLNTYAGPIGEQFDVLKKGQTLRNEIDTSFINYLRFNPDDDHDLEYWFYLAINDPDFLPLMERVNFSTFLPESLSKNKPSNNVNIATCLLITEEFYASYLSQAYRLLEKGGNNLFGTFMLAYFSWEIKTCMLLFDDVPVKDYASEIASLLPALYAEQVQETYLFNLYDYLFNNPYYQKTNNKNHLYQGYEHVESITHFDGLGYFLDKLQVANINSFPNNTFVPIDVGGITSFIPYNGYQEKALGTPYVHRGLIKGQTSQLLNRTRIEGFQNPDQQQRALYDNAVELSKIYNLEIGQALTPEQVINIPLDVIWPELELVDGQSVMAPKVYLTQSTLDTRLDRSGNLLAFGSANLNYDEVNINGARVVAERNFIIQTNNFINSNGNIDVGGELTISAGRCIVNNSGVIGAGNINFLANTMVNRTLVTRHDYAFGYSESAQQLATIKSLGDLNINTAGDVINQGAHIAVAGDITINAGGSIQILAQGVSDFNSQSAELDDGHGNTDEWSYTASAIEHIQSQLSADEISLLANEEIIIQAAIIEAEGALKLLAGMGIYIIDAENSTYEDFKFTGEDGGTFGGPAVSGLGGGEVSDSEQKKQTRILSSVLKAGKDVLLHSNLGNVVLRATSFEAQGMVKVIAEDGSIHFELAKETDYYSYEEFSDDTLVFNTKGHGHHIETGIYNKILAQGGLILDAGRGIKVDYVGTGEPAQIIQELASSSESLAWMEEALLNSGVSYNQIEDLVNQHWSYDQSGLTEAGAIIVAIAAAAIVGPAANSFFAAGGAAGAGAGAGAGFAASVQAAAIMPSFISANAALAAGVTTIAVQGTTMAVNGALNDDYFTIDDTFKQLISDEGIKSLATSMLTAGIMEGIGGDFFDAGNTTQALVEANIDLTLLQQAQRAMTFATVNTGANYIINGGSLEDLGENFAASLGSYAAAQIGKEVAGEIKSRVKENDFNTAAQYIAHAALGCGLGALKASTNGDSADLGCASGSAGAVIGELTAEVYKNLDDNWRDNRDVGANYAELMAALAVAFAGGDVAIAAFAGRNAAENNSLAEIFNEIADKALCRFSADQSACSAQKDAKWDARWASHGEAVKQGFEAEIASIDLSEIPEDIRQFINAVISDAFGTMKAIITSMPDEVMAASFDIAGGLFTGTEDGEYYLFGQRLGKLTVAVATGGASAAGVKVLKSAASVVKKPSLPGPSSPSLNGSNTNQDAPVVNVNYPDTTGYPARESIDWEYSGAFDNNYQLGSSPLEAIVVKDLRDSRLSEQAILDVLKSGTQLPALTNIVKGTHVYRVVPEHDLNYVHKGTVRHSPFWMTESEMINRVLPLLNDPAQLASAFGLPTQYTKYVVVRASLKQDANLYQSTIAKFKVRDKDDHSVTYVRYGGAQQTIVPKPDMLTPVRQYIPPNE